MSGIARAIGVGLACLTLAGCPKKDKPDEKPDAGASANASANALADSGASASAADAGAGASAKAGASFLGKYVVTAGTMYVPAEKDWAAVKFKNDDSKLLGDGDLTLTIDAAGRVSGSTDAGPLGASLIEGSSDGATLAATIRRKDPTDQGLTGTLVAKIAADKLEGSMNLADVNAAVVRVATFTATKK